MKMEKNEDKDSKDWPLLGNFNNFKKIVEILEGISD